MRINTLKLAAALFVISSIVALFLNDYKYNAYVFILNLIGIALFLLALIKNSKANTKD